MTLPIDIKTIRDFVLLRKHEGFFNPYGETHATILGELSDKHHEFLYKKNILDMDGNYYRKEDEKGRLVITDEVKHFLKSVAKLRGVMAVKFGYVDIQDVIEAIMTGKNDKSGFVQRIPFFSVRDVQKYVSDRSKILANLAPNSSQNE